MIRTETSLLNLFFLKKKTFEGSEFSWHLRDETRSQSFTSSCTRSTFCFCLQRAGVLFAACGSFVCSELEFRLQRARVLFAACRSLVCSVRKFCLQREVLLFAACSSFVCSVPEFLFAACWSFVCSVREFSLQRVILLVVVCMFFYTVPFLFAVCRRWFFDVLFMFARNFFYLQCFLFVKTVSPVGHRRYPVVSPTSRFAHCLFAYV